MIVSSMLKAWLLNVISVRRQKGKNLIMRNKICQALIKELKGTKVTQGLEWACIYVNFRLMWQTQLIDKGGVNSNLFYF